MSRQLLNVSRDGDATASLGKPCHYLASTEVSPDVHAVLCVFHLVPIGSCSVSGHQLQIVCLHLLCSLPSGIYSLNKIPPEPSLPQAVQSQLLHLVTSIQQGYALWMPLVNLKCYLQGKWCLNYRVKYYDMQQAYHILKGIICGFFRNYFKQF